MAYESRIEDMVDSVVDFVEAGVGTYLSGMEAAKADGIALPDFTSVEVGEWNEGDVGSCPALLGFPFEVSVSFLTTGTDLMTVKMDLLAVLTDGNPGALLRKAMRYAECMRQCLTDDPSCGGAVDGMEPEVVIELPPATGDGAYKKTVVVTAIFRKEMAR